MDEHTQKKRSDECAKNDKITEILFDRIEQFLSIVFAEFASAETKYRVFFPELASAGL